MFKTFLNFVSLKIFSALCYLYELFEYYFKEERKSNKLLRDNKSTEIEILSTTIETNNDNLLRYLRHHVASTGEEFQEVDFEDKLQIVEFFYNNEHYIICLRRLKSLKDDHLEVKRGPSFILAILKDNNNDSTDLTEKIKKLHGPTRNFFSHIPDTLSEIDKILTTITEYRGTLNILDMNANTTSYSI